MLFIRFENFQETLVSRNIFPFYCSIFLIKNYRNIINNYYKKYRYVYLINSEDVLNNIGTLSVSGII